MAATFRANVVVVTRVHCISVVFVFCDILQGTELPF